MDGGIERLAATLAAHRAAAGAPSRPPAGGRHQARTVPAPPGSGWDLVPGGAAAGATLLPRGWIVATGSLVAAREVLDEWLDDCPAPYGVHGRGWILLTHAVGRRVRDALAAVLRAVPGALPEGGGPSPVIVVLGHPVSVRAADLRALRVLPSLLALPMDARLAGLLARRGDAGRAQLLDDVRTAIGLLDREEPRPDVLPQDAGARGR